MYKCGKLLVCGFQFAYALVYFTPLYRVGSHPKQTRDMVSYVAPSKHNLLRNLCTSSQGILLFKLANSVLLGFDYSLSSRVLALFFTWSLALKRERDKRPAPKRVEAAVPTTLHQKRQADTRHHSVKIGNY